MPAQQLYITSSYPYPSVCEHTVHRLLIWQHHSIFVQHTFKRLKATPPTKVCIKCLSRLTLEMLTFMKSVFCFPPFNRTTHPHVWVLNVPPGVWVKQVMHSDYLVHSQLMTVNSDAVSHASSCSSTCVFLGRGRERGETNPTAKIRAKQSETLVMSEYHQFLLYRSNRSVSVSLFTYDGFSDGSSGQNVLQSDEDWKKVGATFTPSPSVPIILWVSLACTDLVVEREEADAASGKGELSDKVWE